MRSIQIIIFSFMLLIPGMLSAELYKYYDQNGALCFTDDFSMVPEGQRPKVEALQEIKSKPDLDNDVGTETESNSREANEIDVQSELEEESKQLESIKKELDDEYLLLKEQRDQLISEAQETMNSEKINDYNQRANDLNQTTLKYKEKRQTYLNRVEAYNLKLRSVQ